MIENSRPIIAWNWSKFGELREDPLRNTTAFWAGLPGFRSRLDAGGDLWLAMVLALSSWHFLRLPDASRAPDRPSGGLLYVPMVLGFLLAAIPIMGTAYHFGPIMKLCGTLLLGSWAILVVWDGIRNRALSRSVFAATEAGNDHGSYRNESV